jgi:hypothetical protein
MVRKPIFWIGLLAVLLMAVACSPATAPTAVPTEAVEATPAPPTAIPPTDPFPTPTAESLTDVSGQGADALRPSAPAAPDEYRFDPPELVGATGNPQLVEFFTTW